MLLEPFFVNFCILYTVLFLLHHFFRKIQILEKSPIQGKVLVGFLNGLFGVLLIHFGIKLSGGTVIDLRIIPMMVAAQVGGWLSALITTVIIILGRYMMFPVTHASIINILVLGVSALFFFVITAFNIERGRKWYLMMLTFLIVMGFSINFVFANAKEGLSVFFQYGFAIIAATVATHLLTFYLWRNKENYDKLQELAHKDYLTGLNNTRSFYDAIKVAFPYAKEKNEELVLIMIDIDNFKQVNDTYGHSAGDKVLKQLATILLNSCRSNDIVSRYGGEEFSVIMPDCYSATAVKIAENIRKTVEKTPFVINDTVNIKITISMGFATTKQNNILSFKELINKSDKELYLSKEKGKNRISGYQVV